MVEQRRWQGGRRLSFISRGGDKALMDEDSYVLHIQMIHQPLHFRLCWCISGFVAAYPDSSLHLRDIPHGPSLLMKLAFLLRGVGAEVVLTTNQKPVEADEVVNVLEHKVLDRGVQVISTKIQKAIDTALKYDMVVLNTAVAGKWLDAFLQDNFPKVLPTDY